MTKTTSRPRHLRLVPEADNDPELAATKAFFRREAERQPGGSYRKLPQLPKVKPPRRPSFFMMDHDLLTALGRALDLPALVLISEIDRLVFTTRKNPVRFPNAGLRKYGLSRGGKDWWLRRLQKVGAIELVWHRGRAPLVTWNNPDRPR
jgi:hypothetical protein